MVIFVKMNVQIDYKSSQIVNTFIEELINPHRIRRQGKWFDSWRGHFSTSGQELKDWNTPFFYFCILRNMENLDPCPTSLLTSIRPPLLLTIRFIINKPKPDPSTVLLT